MKWTGLLLIGALLAAWPCAAQSDSDRRRAAGIQAKIRGNEPVSPEDREFMQQMQKRQREEYAKNNPPRDFTGMAPLPELGKGTYKGEQGGLYPEGANIPPAAHQKAGLKIARGIRPLDAEGHESNDGKIVMVSTGMSNTTMESQAFAKLLKEASGINPKYQFVDCAQGGQTALVTSKPDANYWKVAEQRLTAAGVTPKQVQVAWIKQADIAPRAEFPEEVKKLEAELAATLHNLHDKYPNIKIAYLSSRIYAGYATTGLNPEPHAYEGGFAVKWLVAGQIAGNPELNYDPAKGAVKSPWIAWGPYLWADGVKSRSDGLTWAKDDLVEQDRTHPSQSGREKVAKLLLEFLKKDPASTPWFAK
jgi:hypothetical protein